MKKKVLTALGALLVVTLVVVVCVVNRPYKPVSFVVDGENFSASVENGDTLILELPNHNSCEDEWEIVLTPEFFASDYCNTTGDITEFHIIALKEGTGEMAFHHTQKDGTIAKYILTLSISRHQKTYLQIDEVSFGEYK